MFAIIYLLAAFIADLFKPPRRLEVENLFLRHQLNIALRRAPQRVRLRAGDRALMVWMTRRWPSLLGLSRVVQPDTILRGHRACFRAYWRWMSRGRAGRPRVSRELRELIQRMSKENPLWGICLYRKSDSAVMMMKSAEDGRRYNAARVLDGAMDRSVFIERPM